MSFAVPRTHIALREQKIRAALFAVIRPFAKQTDQKQRYVGAAAAADLAVTAIGTACGI
jgi:hypothetical protein